MPAACADLFYTLPDKKLRLHNNVVCLAFPDFGEQLFCRRCPLGNTGLLNRCQRRADQRSEFIAVDADDRKIIRNTEAAVNRISDKYKSKSISLSEVAYEQYK